MKDWFRVLVLLVVSFGWQFGFGQDVSDSSNDISTTFRNGEDRNMVWGDGQLHSGGPGNFSLLDVTAWAFHATWTRDIRNVDTISEAYISHLLTWIPRNPDGTLNTSAFQRVEYTGCEYQDVADGGGGTGGDPEAGGDTPIVIDLDNDGIVRLTNRDNGVMFDLRAIKQKIKTAWLADDNAGWLVFDMFGAGVIDSGRLLFGNASFQADPFPGEPRNGYRALRIWDDNKDGKIDASDGIYSVLGIWIDRNKDGVSDPGEVVYLPYTNIESISLDYKESRRKDRHGNEFRYRAKVKFRDGTEGHSFDVILNNK